MFAKPYIVGSVVLTPVPFAGTTPEGSRYEWSSLQLGRVDEAPGASRLRALRRRPMGARRSRASTIWPPRSSRRTGSAGATVENMASRRTAGGAVGSGWKRPGSVHRAHDLVRVDHRRVIGVPTTTTREEFVDAARAFAGLGMTDLTFETLAVRGDRSCLGRLTYSGADFDATFLTVVCCNDRNKMAWIDNYDDDSLADALAMLDERYALGEGAEHASLIRRSGDFGRAYRDRDWTALRELFAPDADARRPSVDRTGLERSGRLRCVEPGRGGAGTRCQARRASARSRRRDLAGRR